MVWPGGGPVWIPHGDLRGTLTETSQLPEQALAEVSREHRELSLAVSGSSADERHRFLRIFGNGRNR